MSESTPGKAFNIPRIKRLVSKDNLSSTNLDSRDAKELEASVKRSFLDQNYNGLWKLQAVQLINNKELEEEYRLKRQELKDESRHARDLVDQFAFMAMRNESIVPKIAKEGLKARPNFLSILGDSSNGVHLCRHADVQLRAADSFATNTCKVVVFRVMLGKCKAFQPSYEKCATYEPTPNYDCHVSVHPAQSRDSSFIHQLAHSQVFFYEYTDEAIPSNRPRQCLPHAVLTYSKTKGSGQVELTSYGTAVKAYVPVKDKYPNKTLIRDGSKLQDGKVDQQNLSSKKPLLSLPASVQAHRTALENQPFNKAQPNQGPSKVVVQKTRADPRCAVKQRRESEDSSLITDSLKLNIDGANEAKANRPNISDVRPAGAFHRALSNPEFLTPPNPIFTRSPKILSPGASEVKNRSPNLSPGVSPHANLQGSPSSFIAAYNTRHIGLNDMGKDPSRVQATAENLRQHTHPSCEQHRSQDVIVADTDLNNPDAASEIEHGLSIEEQMSAATYGEDDYGNQDIYSSEDGYHAIPQYLEMSATEQRRRMHDEHPTSEGCREMHPGYRGNDDCHGMPHDQPGFHNDPIPDSFGRHIHYQSEAHRPGYDDEESDHVYNSTQTMSQWQSPEKEKVQSPFGIPAQDMDYRRGPFSREVDTDYRSMSFSNDVDMRRNYHTAPQHEAILGSGDVDYRMLGTGQPHPSSRELVGHDPMDQEGMNSQSDPSQEQDELRWSSPYSINMAAALSPFIASSPESVKLKASPKAMRGKLVCSIPPAPSTSTSESILQYTSSVAGVKKNLSDTSFEDDMDVCTSDSDVEALKNKTKDTFYSLNTSSDTESRQDIACHETDGQPNATVQSTETSVSDPTVPKFDSAQLKDLISDTNVPKFDTAQLKELIDDGNVPKFDSAQLKDLISDSNVPKFDSTQLKELIRSHPGPSEQNVPESDAAPVIDNISDANNAQSQNLKNNDACDQNVPKFDSAQLKELVSSGFVLIEPKVPKFDTAQLKNIINTVDMAALKNIVAKCQGDSDGGVCKEPAKKLDSAYKIVAGVKTKYNYVVKKKRSQSNESSLPISVSQNKVTDKTITSTPTSDQNNQKDHVQKFGNSETKMPSPVKIPPVHTVSAESQRKKMEAGERSGTFGWIDQTLVKRQLDQIKNATDLSSSDTESFALSELAAVSDVDVSKDELVTDNVISEDNGLFDTAVDGKKSPPRKCDKKTPSKDIVQTKEATVDTSDSDDLYDKPLVIIEQDCDVSTSQEVDSSSESQRLSQGDATLDDTSEVLDENSKDVGIDINLRKKKRKNPSMMGYKTRKKKRKKGGNVHVTTEISVKSKERGGSEKTPKPDSDSVKKTSTKHAADKTELKGTKFREISGRSFLDTLGVDKKDTKPDNRSDNDEEMLEIDYNDFSFDQPFDCFESIPDCLPLSDPQNSYEDISDAEETETKESLNNSHPPTTVFERTLSQACYEDISDEDDVGKCSAGVVIVNESVTMSKDIDSNSIQGNDMDESPQNKLRVCEKIEVDGANNITCVKTAMDSNMEICPAAHVHSPDSLRYQTAVKATTDADYGDMKMDQTVHEKSTVITTNDAGLNANSEMPSARRTKQPLQPLMQLTFTVPWQRKEASLIAHVKDSRLNDWTDAAKYERFQRTVVVSEQKRSTSPEAFTEPDKLTESRTIEEQPVVENVAEVVGESSGAKTDLTQLLRTEPYLNESISIEKTEPVNDAVQGNHPEIVTEHGNDNTLQSQPHGSLSHETTSSLLSMDTGQRLPRREISPLMGDDMQNDQHNSSKQHKSNDIKILTSINKMKPNFVKKPFSKSRKRPSFKGIAQLPRHRANVKKPIEKKDDEADVVETHTSTNTSLSTDILPLGDPSELVESGNERDKDYVARREIKLTLIASVKQSMLSQKAESTPTKDDASEMRGSPIPVLGKLDSPVTTMSVSKSIETKVSVPETMHTITTVGSSIPVLGQVTTPAVLPNASDISISVLRSSQPAPVSPVVAGSSIPVLQHLGSSETQTPSLPASHFAWQLPETTNWSASSHAFQPIHDNPVLATFAPRSLMPPTAPPFQLQAPPMPTPEQPFHFPPVCAPLTSAMAMSSHVMHTSMGLPLVMQTPIIGHPAMERMLHPPPRRPPVIHSAHVNNLQLIVTNPPPPMNHTLPSQHVISAHQNLLHGTDQNQGLSQMGPSHGHLPVPQASKSNVIDWFTDKITPKHSTNIVVVSGEERPNSTNDEDEEIQAINSGLHVVSRASSLQRDDTPPKSPGTPLMEEGRTRTPGTPLMEEGSTASLGTPLLEEGSTPSPGTPLMEEDRTPSPGTPLMEEDRTSSPGSLTRSPRERSQSPSDAKYLNLLSQARHQLLRELETIGSDSGEDDASLHSEESHQSTSRSRSREKLPREDIYYRARSKSNSSVSSCQSQKGVEDGEITDASSASTPSGDIEPDEYQIETQSTDYQPIPTIGRQTGMSRRVPKIGFTWSKMITKKPGNITLDYRFSDGLELSPSDLTIADTSETIQCADILEESVRRKPSPATSSNPTPGTKREESADLSNVPLNPKIISQIVDNINIYQVTIGEWMRTVVGNNDQLLHLIEDLLPYPKDQYMAGLSKNRRRTLKKRVKDRLLEVFSKQMKPTDNQQSGDTVTAGASDSYVPSTSGMRESSVSPDLISPDLDNSDKGSEDSAMTTQSSDQKPAKMRGLMDAPVYSSTPPPMNEPSPYSLSFLGPGLVSEGPASKEMLADVMMEYLNYLKFRPVAEGNIHEKVPRELLMPVEFTSMFSMEGVFLVLSCLIPKRPYERLITLRSSLIFVEQEMNQCGLVPSPRLISLVNRKNDIHMRRKGLLSNFTGTVSFKHLRKLESQRNCYAFCSQQPLVQSEHGFITFVNHNLRAVCNHIEVVETLLRSASQSRCQPSIATGNRM